jgi:hypothetical protein
MKDTPPLGTSTFTIEDLLKLYDEAFVMKAYTTILGRAPDQGGLENYLAQVRTGVHKAQIVAELALSPEGKDTSAELPGLQSIIARYRKRAPSLWQRLFQRMTSAATEPTERHLRAIDNQLYLLEQSLSAQAKQLADLLTLAQNRMMTPGIGKSGYLGSVNDAIRTPRLSYLSPNLARTFTELKTAIAMHRAKDT